MKDSSKQAKFFCESCGAEVNASAKFCNNCGKFFSSVRCPNCGKTGTTKEFEEGCPECGYAVGKHGNNGSLFGFFSSNKSGNSNVFSGLSSLFGKNKRNNSRKTSSSDSLPIWVYVVVIGILIAVIVCLYSCL